MQFEEPLILFKNQMTLEIKCSLHYLTKMVGRIVGLESTVINKKIK
jgi:hypothetical protein